MSLVRHYPMQDNAASTVVVGAVGGDGTLNGGDNTSTLVTTGPGGSYPSALLFDGTSDWVSFPTVTITGTGTWSFWAKRTTTTNSKTILGNASGGTSVRVQFNATATGIQVRFVSAATLATLAHGVTPTDWHHYLFARDASDIGKFYVDGALVSSDIFGGAQAGSSGAWAQIAQHANSQRFDGALADVRIYDSDESANAAAIYAEGVASAGIKYTQLERRIRGLNRGLA